MNIYLVDSMVCHLFLIHSKIMSDQLCGTFDFNRLYHFLKLCNKRCTQKMIPHKDSLSLSLFHYFIISH